MFVLFNLGDEPGTLGTAYVRRVVDALNQHIRDGVKIESINVN